MRFLVAALLLSVLAVDSASAQIGETLKKIGKSGAKVGIAAMPIGPEKEIEIGRGIAAVVVGRYKLHYDPELSQYVNLVGLAVAEQSPRRGEIPFRFGILNSDDVNAFAAPGGYILVTRGALALMESEAELAGVLAHEVGHVDSKHVLDEVRRAGALKTVKEEADLKGALLDSIAAFGTSMLFTGLSREDELEADSLGLIYAAAAGYRTDGLLRFVRSLQQAEQAEGGKGGKLRELKATHPPAADRALAIERQMKALELDPMAGEEVAERFRENVRKGG
ncbi:MAG: M48 family metalloprotease [Gemmatimonadetes bacterium]|nr:M48 family metalloprotease [Gemmatimonadota bacterium]